MKLNKEQNDAVFHGEGPCMVLAPPGSGKTLVITRRVQHLIEKVHIPPEKILVITFTRYAAREMKERFEKLVNGMNYPVTFGTFHSVFYSILKQEYVINSHHLLSEQESLIILKESLNQTYIESDVQVEDEEELLRDIAQEIGVVKNGLYRLDEFHSQHLNTDEFTELFRAYESKKKQVHKFDFDDMLVQCYALFRKYSSVLHKWQRVFRYILIDEFQDINKVQYEVIKMLALPENNLFVVGDDDQSIYGFRGSDPEFMQDMRKDFPNLSVIPLSYNYRSTEYIVGAASRVIFHNEKRLRKQVMAFKDKGKSVHIQEVRDQAEECEYVVSELAKKLQEGWKPCEIAVLYRAGIHARMLTEMLKDRQISFQMKEYVPNFYKHFIVKDMLAYMQLAMGKRDRHLFLLICNRPVRYLARNAMSGEKISFEDLRRFYCDKEWMQDIIDQFDIDIRMIQNMAPYAAVQYIRKRIGYDDFLKKYCEEKGIPLQQCMEVLQEFEIRCKQYQNYQDLLEHVRVYTEELEEQEKRKGYKQSVEDEKIQLMTMHAAKGLEFRAVFIIHANEGDIPYQKAKSVKNLEEERRLFYVGMTRAKEELLISYYVENNGNRVERSRFVDEILGRKKKG